MTACFYKNCVAHGKERVFGKLVIIGGDPRPRADFQTPWVFPVDRTILASVITTLDASAI